MLTLRGIYGREMYETWYKMTVMLQSGLDIGPAITHRFAFRDHEAAFAAARSRRSGKVDHGLEPEDATCTADDHDVRTDPLAFLADEVADAPGEAPLPAAAGDVVAPRARSSSSTAPS